MAHPQQFISRMALIVALGAAAPAIAQVQPAPDQAAMAEDEVNENDVIIVTGTAGGGIRRQDAAFALTTVDNAAIDRLAPASTADLFRVIPGVSAESSGGQNGANIFVRGYPSGGDAEFVTLQTEGVPFFPAATLSFLENTQLIRLDETLERIEAVRGGTGALFSSGQPGLTVNFVQRKGGREFAGLAKLSATDFGELRADGYVSGPIGPETTFMIGGYYAASKGIRDTQFTSEKGGQISANIEHKFDRGSLLVFGRYLDDRGQWLLPIPVVIDSSGNVSDLPGFDAGTGTFAGNETRLARLNDGTSWDLADGRGAKLFNGGINFNYELADGLTIRDRASYLKGSADTTGLVPAGGTLQTAAQAAVRLGGAGSTIGALTYTNGGGAVPNAAAQQVIQIGFWVVRKDIEAFVNDLALEYKSGGNTFTVGAYYTAYSSQDKWNLGNGQLLTVEPNARRLDLTLADGRQASRSGFVQGSFFNVNASYDAKDVALYAVDEFQVTPELRIDGGVRWQRHSVDGTLENNTFGVDTDGNPNTLFNNGSAVLNGSFTPLVPFRDDKLSWTAGANYDFSSEVSAFVRYSRGHSFPFFDDLRDGIRQVRRVDSYEAGLKLSTDLFSLYATAFHNDFKGLVSTQLINGVTVANIGGARANGLELEGAIRPIDGLSIGFGGTYLDGKYRDFFAGNVDQSGNQVQRQPKWQWRVTPSYEARFGDDTKATVFTTVAYLGDRFSDVQNLQTLPNFIKWDAGVSLDLNQRVEIVATVDNITDEIGLTEGDPRIIGGQGTGTILARPILGRSFRVSAGIKF